MKIRNDFSFSRPAKRHFGEREILTPLSAVAMIAAAYAYPNDCITQSQVVDIANRDTTRLVGETAKYIGKRSPYADTIEGGTMDNSSEIVRTVVAEQAVPAASMVRPLFVPALQACGTAGGTDQVGTTEFQFQLKNLRGRGPKICVKTTRTAWKSSYPAHVAALKDLLLRLTNADIRANYLDNGGCKLVCDSTGSFANSFAGGINAVGTLFPARVPDSPVSHRALEYTRTFMQETLGVSPFDNGDTSDGVFKWIGSMEMIQAFRDELDIKEDIRALAAGRYKMGEEVISGYTFSGPYRGIMHGSDPEPLRASAVAVVANGATDPYTSVVNAGPAYLAVNFVEPTIAVQVTTGYAARPNPAWIAAPFEVGFLFGQKSFKRLVPSSYKVAGWDFSPQITNGGLVFKQLSDADCNLWGDFGQHLYEIERAYQPIQPHAVCAVIYQRCRGAMNLVACLP
jgi:hypothetical protein